MYFDSHAHLGEDCFAQDFVHIVENIRTAGVSGMMEIGFDGPSSYHAVELANRYDWIWAAVGSHPDDAAQVDEARDVYKRQPFSSPFLRGGSGRSCA